MEELATHACVHDRMHHAFGYKARPSKSVQCDLQLLDCKGGGNGHVRRVKAWV